MRLLAGGTVALSALLTGKVVHASGSVASSGQNSALQTLLDDKCQQIFSQLCSEGVSQYCGANGVCRWLDGDNSQKKPRGVCLMESSLDKSQSGEVCVDSCGFLTRCVGVAAASAPHMLDRDAELTQFVKEKKSQTCDEAKECVSPDQVTPEALPQKKPEESETEMPGQLGASPGQSQQAFSGPVKPGMLQEMLDAKCKELTDQACKEGKSVFCAKTPLARYDVGTRDEPQKEWRCYLMSILNMNKEAKGCADNCGGLTTCFGTLNGESADYLSAQGTLRRLIMNSHGVTCNPPETQPSLQQDLNKKCKEFAEEECKKGTDYYCNAEVYARYDWGTEQQRDMQWRCYLKEALNFSIQAARCVSSCGGSAVCSGIVPVNSTKHLTRHKELEALINERKGIYC